MHQRILALAFVSSALFSGDPAFLAPRPLSPVKQMETLRELAFLNPASYAVLLGMRNDPEAAISYTLAVLEERLAVNEKLLSKAIDGKDQLEYTVTKISTTYAIAQVKKWNSRVRIERLSDFRKWVNTESEKHTQASAD